MQTNPTPHFIVYQFTKLVIVLTPFCATANLDSIYDLPPQVVEERFDALLLTETSPFSSVIGIADDEGSLFLSPHLAEQLENALPGVAMQRRGYRSLEPNIGGFVGDDVEVRWNGLKLAQVSPTRTASPLNLIPGNAISTLWVTPSQPSVSGGMGALGGRIEVESYAKLPVGHQAASEHQLGVAASENGKGRNAFILSEHQTSKAGYQVFLNASQNGDYESADGREVDADHEQYSGQLSGSWKLSDGQALQATLLWSRQPVVRNNSLPLDAKNAEGRMGSIRYSPSCGESKWITEAGFGQFETPMDANDRVLPPPLKSITANSEMETFRMGSRFETTPAQSPFRISSGIDFEQVRRDGYRVRTAANSKSFVDPLWPDVKSIEWGVYSKIESIPDAPSPHSWEIGFRVQHRKAWVGKSDSSIPLPLSKGPTVLDNWNAYNGIQSSASNDEWLGKLQGSWTAKLSDNLMLSTGMSYGHFAPALSKRYRALVNALGGDGKGGSAFEIGNPSLKKARQLQWASKLSWKSQRLRVDWNFHWSRVDDYAVRQVIQQLPVTIFGFKNEDVDFLSSSVDLDWTWIDAQHQNSRYQVSFPFQLSWSHAESRQSNLQLVEIPPTRISAGVNCSRDNWAMNAGALWYSQQTNPQPEKMPIYRDTDASTILHWRLQYSPNSKWRIQLSVENVLNELYYSYLQPPVSVGPKPSSGGLIAGDSIPQAGRTFTLQVSRFF